MYTTILTKVEDKIATITINRPEQSNAFAQETYIEVRDALLAFGKDQDVGAIVITGTGKNFSAGGNIANMKKYIDDKTYMSERGPMLTGMMSVACRRCPKPVIAMVNGAAAGAGAGLALACDFRIVSPRSKLIMAFINLGLPGDTAGMYHVGKLVGTAKAMEMMMLGEPIGGEQAYGWGLATRLAADDTLEEETYQFAKKIAHRATYGFAKQKMMMNKYFYPELDAFIVDETAGMCECSRTEDHAEAVHAFLEKRAPVFKGK
ncbi:enoyl-CoA hydratase/isomerase family protein [Lawsonibacter celer]|uniref:enoyl-CoA hydratase/isomerase family protein n=1 Tax=Lawsonibacter celer TaxID=2986526 RepID=UPI0016455F01|nr:enoyl-CoA hydratase-related protein [Lawsonibacter celer]